MINDNLNGAYSLTTGDIDGDGDLDIISGTEEFELDAFYDHHMALHTYMTTQRGARKLSNALQTQANQSINPSLAENNKRHGRRLATAG